MNGPPLSMLARPLRERERAAIARRWKAALRARRSCALPATAFVSLYERGRVIGCVGHADCRAALEAAQADPRFGGAREPIERATVQLSLLVRGPVVASARVPETIALGEHGLVAFDAAGAVRAVLLPEAAPDGQRDGAAMLRALLDKAGARDTTELARVMLVMRERFVARAAGGRVRAPIDAAAAWLAARVDADGAIAHGVDARSGRVHRTGPFHLGRAALVVEALAAHGGHRAVVRRAQAWLTGAITAALEKGGDGLPRAPAERAASLALALRAGVACRAPLVALAHSSSGEIASVPWHAAQVVVALGTEAPPAAIASALAPIDADTWSPWSALAADAIGDRARARRARRRVARGIPTRGPHPGGVRTRTVPEVAMTALAIEVLAGERTHAGAVTRALSFLATQRFASIADVPAALDPALALGAFPLAPHADFLRCDVTAHALLALLAAERGLRARRAR